MIESIWPLARNRNSGRRVVDRIASRLRKMPGFCNICGRGTIFDVSDSNFREWVNCWRCGSRNRQRQIAAVLLTECGLKERFCSLSSLPKNVIVWNTEATRSLHENLKSHLSRNYISSEYLSDQLGSGEVRNGVMHVDMRCTHFESNSIDYILSGDVLEHMPDPVMALRESYRVLRPGGCHIFTVPFYQHRFTIERRSEVMEDGQILHHKRPWFHDDPVRPSEGALVFNVFAPEILCEIERIGFEAKLLLLHNYLYGIYGDNGIVLVAKKSASPSHERDWIFPED